MSHPQIYLQISVSRPIPQSCGMDGTFHGILTCPILKYTSKSQCPVPSHSPVGWTRLSMGFSHVPSSNIPPNLVLWDGRDCPWDSHMSHPQIYLQIPVSHPILQSCGMDGTVHGILTCPTLGYIPVSRPSPQSCGMDGTVHGILTCPILKYTSKSSPVGWTGLSMGFSHVPSSNIPPNPSVLSQPTVPWDCPLDSHMSPFHVD